LQKILQPGRFLLQEGRQLEQHRPALVAERGLVPVQVDQRLVAVSAAKRATTVMRFDALMAKRNAGDVTSAQCARTYDLDSLRSPTRAAMASL
jgi:hypothetical protein